MTRFKQARVSNRAEDPRNATMPTIKPHLKKRINLSMDLISKGKLDYQEMGLIAELLADIVVRFESERGD